MKLWVDDVRREPEGWIWARTIQSAKLWIIWYDEFLPGQFEECSLDHDMGAGNGNEGHDLLRWMCEFNYWPNKKPVIHSSNPYEVNMMRQTIDRYWTPPRGQPGVSMANPY